MHDQWGPQTADAPDRATVKEEGEHDRLRIAIGDLERAINILADRLQPVLRYAEPEHDEVPHAAPGSPIEESRMALARETRRLGALTDRIAL